jgi:hypothetical protein
MDKLWIDGQLADLDDNRAAFTFQTWNLLAFSSRQVPYSFGLKLADTALNRSLLGIPIMGGQTTIPYAKTPAMYEADGIFIIGVGGYIVAESIDESGDYLCTIYGVTAEFWSVLKEKKITELTTLDNMNWLLSEIVSNGKWSNWPIIDWNEETTSAQFNDNPDPGYGALIVDFMKIYPGETLKKILTAIFLENGYEIFDTAASAWVDAKFNRVFVPCVRQLASPLVGPQMAQAYCKRTTLTSIESILVAQTYYYFDLPDTPFIQNYADVLYTDTDPAGLQSTVLYYNVRSPGTYSIHATLYLAWSGPSYSHWMAFEVWSPTQGRALFGDRFNIPVGGAGSTTLDINRSGIEISEVGIICVRLYDASWEPGLPLTVKDGSFQVLAVDPVNTAYAYDFDIALNLPDISQLDIVKLWLNITCSMLWVDEESKKIYVYKFEDLYTNTPENWSDYFDSIVEVKYHADGYGQSNKLLYSNDNTVFDATGNHAVAITDEALPEEVELIKLPVSATDDVLHGNDGFTPGGTPTAKIKLRKAGAVENSITDRLLLIDELTATGSPALAVQLTDSVSDVARNPCYFAKFAGLDWATLVQDYHVELFTRALNKSRIVRANFLLPASVVKARRANIPVYVSQLNGLFYCDIIENYMAGELSVVQLIRL